MLGYFRDSAPAFPSFAWDDGKSLFIPFVMVSRPLFQSMTANKSSFSDVQEIEISFKPKRRANGHIVISGINMLIVMKRHIISSVFVQIDNGSLHVHIEVLCQFIHNGSDRQKFKKHFAFSVDSK